MRYTVRCSNRDCYLHHTEARVQEVHVAENLAFAHERRMEDRNEGSHIVTVEDTLFTGGTATGQGGKGNSNEGRPLA